MPTNAAMIAANDDRWLRAKIKPEWQAAIDKTAMRLVADKARFLTIEKRDGVRWFVVAIIKEREAGADPAFKLSIAQGDPWSARSIHVPKGRGAFSSWEDAAHDALVDCAPFAARWHDWSIGGLLTILEKYNGVGYAARGLPSPYDWAATTIYIKGKFVRDGVFDPEFVDRQIGCAALLIAMQKLDPSITFDQPGAAQPRATPAPPPILVDAATKTARQVRTGSLVGTAAAGGNAASEIPKTTSTTTTPPAAPLIPAFASYTLIGVAVAIAIGATVAVAKAKSKIVEIW